MFIYMHFRGVFCKQRTKVSISILCNDATMLWKPVIWLACSVLAVWWEMSKSILPQGISFEQIFLLWIVGLWMALNLYVFYLPVEYWHVSFLNSVFQLSVSVFNFMTDPLPDGMWYSQLSLQIRRLAEQYSSLNGLDKSEDIPEINYFLLQSPSVEILTFPVMLQAIQREKPEKYRKLQDASRSAEALVEQMVNGNYMGVEIDNLLRAMINAQVCICHKNYISKY